jgi:VIT1/CCC1 family predicted Fe2+/Mn2+ transporter
MNQKQKYTREDLEKHIHDEHKLSPVSEYLREIVYGGVDGIVTTFAVVAGFTGASAGANTAKYSIAAVLLFGLANLFADGASMGLGNFLSIRSDKKVYKNARKKEAHEVKTNREEEIQETEFLLQEKGFSEDDAKKLTAIYQKNDEYWTDFMMHYELEMDDPGNENPLFTGFATFFSFIVFGFVPLIPYLFVFEVQSAFIGSIVATLIALIVLGILRFVTTKEKPLPAIAEMVLLGGTSAVIAYIVGVFFRE